MKPSRSFFPSLILATLAVQVHAQEGSGAAPSIKAGIGVASYEYHEPAVMKTRGNKIAADIGVNWALTSDYFGAASLRYVTGSVDYRSDAQFGSASANDKRDYYIETRALAGRRMRFGGTNVALFTGLGYRYLYNDLRGLNTLGQAGNRRTNAMVYLPVGVTLSRPIEGASRVEAGIEWNQLLYGRQKTYLSDSLPNYADVSNTQRVGYGIRLHLGFARDNWMIRPYLDYWRIAASDKAPLIVNGAPFRDSNGQLFIQEPRNWSTEAGLKLEYLF